jgi:cytochrome P450
MTPVLLHDDFIQQRGSSYTLLRQDSPVTQAVTPRGMPFWLVTRYEDAKVVLADPTTTKSADVIRQLTVRDSRSHYAPALVAHMLNSDPPRHSRLRKLVSKAFTPGMIDKLRPRVEQITDSLLDEMAGHDQVDLLDALAFPLPITVICELLGVPPQDRADFRTWSNILMSADEWEKVASASRTMSAYLGAMIGELRAHPDDTMMSALIQATDEGDQLTENELVAMAFLLLIAGHETTVNLIGNGVYALLRNPDQLALLKADPSLLPGAVEEVLRLDSPVDLTTLRITTAPIQVGAVVIPAEQVVMVSLVSANRDLDRFDDPDRLDITRKAAGHLAFGHGIHYCLGAPLARMEGRIAIGKLLDRFPRLALAGDAADLRWRFSTLIHGLESLPVLVNG